MSAYLGQQRNYIDADAVKITLLGDPVYIKEKAKQLDLLFDFEKINIIDPLNSTYFDDYSEYTL